MPTQIVELDDLVPDEIEFRYQGKKYFLPGDISVETTFRLEKLLKELQAAEKDPKKKNQQVKLTLEVEEVLLGLFRQKNPDLEKLPFGVVGFSLVLTMILSKLGFAMTSENGDGADPPKPNRAQRRSRRSSTSRSL